MKTIVVANQKGGSGKSTVTVHLAAAAESAGDGPVVISDTDPQGTAADWFNQRKKAGIDTPRYSPLALDDLGGRIQALGDAGASYLFIDTAPSIGAVNANLFAKGWSSSTARIMAWRSRGLDRLRDSDFGTPSPCRLDWGAGWIEQQAAIFGLDLRVWICGERERQGFFELFLKVFDVGKATTELVGKIVPSKFYRFFEDVQSVSEP